MSRLQFWIFTVSSVLVALLFAGEIFANHDAQAKTHELVVLERLVPEGRDSYKLWQQLAGRTYVLSQQDPALKQVLVREQIKVTPHQAPAAPASTPSPAAAANPPAKTR